MIGGFNPRSRKGNDVACYAYDYLFEYVSIHVPARGTTEMDLPSARGSSVSIHVPARGTTKNGSAVVSQIMFQSTFPQGERQRKEKKYEHTDSFNPRSRKGNDVPTIPKVKNPTVSIHVPARGTTTGKPVKGGRNKFQSTFPQGERQRLAVHHLLRCCFNPRSRKGNDSNHL